MALSKAKIDKAGRLLSKENELTAEMIELEDVFDAYRANHLEPLSRTTLELQSWMQTYNRPYYIAQRLKRKPQIIRKLRRLSVRLTQLQDIGGCRIIVSKNKDVDDLIGYIKDHANKKSDIKIEKETDYRDKGRDITGYRSVHLILRRDNTPLELQIRSRIQHYWAESIERTSVIYGRHLKEQDGDPQVIEYFRVLSDVFYGIENGREILSATKSSLERLRIEAQKTIERSDTGKIFDSFVNEGIIKTLTAKQEGGDALNNWIIVFDWNTGDFLTWDVVSRDPAIAMKKYVSYEKQFPADQKFEVVMIGSSDVATVRQTHSHYFGIQRFDSILESLDESITGFQVKMDIDVGARQILSILSKKGFWGRKTISVDTLKNHFAKGLITFDSSIYSLREKGLVNMVGPQAPVSLNMKRKADIEGYLQ